MLLVDVNLLIYAANARVRQHERAREWLDFHLSGGDRVGLPWAALLSFVRVSSDPRVMPTPFAVSDAMRRVHAWLAAPAAWVPGPTERHAEVLGTLLEQAPRSALVNDAHLAALAVEHGLTLCSADRDFARFDGLRWQNPLV